MISIDRKFDPQTFDPEQVVEALVRLLNGPSANPERETPTSPREMSAAGAQDGREKP